MRRLSRRALLAAAPLAIGAPSAEPQDSTITRHFAALEQRHGGRLGVAILDTANRNLLAYRGEELFPLCSTYKSLAAAFVLARVDRGQERLDRRVAVPRSALVAYSPATEPHAGDAMTLDALCEAALTLSDNTAANLLLGSFGGPAALTGFLRTLGDGTTRVDRPEPAVNEVGPGDPRDSTTPLAMLGSLRRTVLGTALSDASRARLVAWLVGCRTGDHRLRAGIPDGWRVGDKTGTGPAPGHATNDVAVLWPPGRAPIVVTAFYIGGGGTADERDAVLAEIGRIAVQA